MRNQEQNETNQNSDQHWINPASTKSVLKMKTKVAIVFGGRSSEYCISLQSAAAVLRHINQQQYDIVMIGITKDGDWMHYTGSIDAIENDTWSANACQPVTCSLSRRWKGFLILEETSHCEIAIDVVFPVLHGKYGEDGTLQGLFELAGIPVVGCGMLSSALCMDKNLAHRLVESKGIRVAKSVSYTKKEWVDRTADGSRANQMCQPNNTKLQSLIYPLFVKPRKAGSSHGITKIETVDQLDMAVCHAMSYDDAIVIEEAIPGFEVGCAILGNETLVTGLLDEIEVTSGFFDTTEKYTLQTATIHMPARLSEIDAKRIKQAALTIYQALGCQGMARVDMFFTPEKEIYFNEVNTIPGFTSHSRYPNMMRGIDLSFAALIDRLIDLAVMQ